MKNLFLSFSILLFSVAVSFSQTKHSCCDETNCETTTAPNKMASFSDDVNFKNAHPEPLTFKLTDGKGKMITFKISDGKDANGYEIKADNPTNKWLFVFHEWYGLNDYVKKESEELAANLGVNVLAIDLYDGKLASNNEEASKYVKEVDNTRAINIIYGARDYVGTDAVFGTIGWCFGGAWSNQTAIELGDRCKACVIYYGMPESKSERLAKLKAPVLGIFAKQDGWITPEVVNKFEENLKSLNISAEIYSYDAVHAFANPSNPKHDVDATKDAKEKTLKFLMEKMK